MLGRLGPNVDHQDSSVEKEIANIKPNFKSGKFKCKLMRYYA